MKLGARILKTGIAIVLSLYVARLFHLPAPVFAGIAAVFAVQPTIYRSYLSIIEQIQGNIIGAAFAVIFVLVFGNHAFIIGLAVVIVIIINLKLKLENSMSLSLVTLIAIMETPGDTFIQFALIRFSTIMLGVFSAFIVNLVFLPPKYEKKLYFKISDMTEEVTRWIRLTTRHASEHTFLKNDIEKIKDNLLKLNQLYLMYKEERDYFKRKDLVKSRKLVIYRQMIYTVKRALETLRKLHRYENDLTQLPTQFQADIQQEIDCLIERHEQIMLKFIGKIKANSPVIEEGFCINRKDLFNLLLSYQKEMELEQDTTFFHIMQIIASIIEYDEHLEHLDVLITSFQSYHKSENELKLDQPDEV